MNRKGKGRVRHARGTSEDALTGIDGQSDALTSVVDILSKSNISDQQEAATNEEGVVGLIGAAEHAVGRNVKITGTSSQQRNPKKRTREDLTTDAESEDTDDDQTDGEAIKTSEAVSSLIDVEKPQVKGRRGRDRLLVKLAIICRHRDTDKLYWRCSATNCDYNRGDKIRKPQVLNHAKVCQYLDESLKLEAEHALINLETKKMEKLNQKQQEVPAKRANLEAEKSHSKLSRLSYCWCAVMDWFPGY
ncbi:hypothetical protein CPB86DRAFT_108158 [Serendipita vermifera]|nr:hypothetical protein CPB86DRAFT_108158 [Serendipita vermifera]